MKRDRPWGLSLAQAGAYLSERIGIGGREGVNLGAERSFEEWPPGVEYQFCQRFTFRFLSTGQRS